LTELPGTPFELIRSCADATRGVQLAMVAVANRDRSRDLSVSNTDAAKVLTRSFGITYSLR